MALTNILLFAGLVGIGALLLQPLWRRQTFEGTEEIAALKAQITQKTEEVGNLKSTVEQSKKELNELQGKGKISFSNQTKLEAKNDTLISENEKLKKQVTTMEVDQNRQRKEHADQIMELKESRHALENETQRIRKADLDRLQKEEEERDRLWANHEASVISRLTDLCKQPQYSFTHFSNTNLPEDFDGSLKPDFMIDFLGQYVIFDAKVSKAKSLQTYINDTVKTTVQKVKKNPKIYSTIFLVVPMEAVSELKTHYYPHDGYTLFVVSPEALPPILACYKRITAYAQVEQLDPQERENIVNFIAGLDMQISMQNASNIILTRMGANMLEKLSKLPPDLATEVSIKRQEMKIPNFNNSEMKRLAGNPSAQIEALDELITPKALVSQKDLDTAKSIIIEETLEKVMMKKAPKLKEAGTLL